VIVAAVVTQLSRNAVSLRASTDPGAAGLFFGPYLPGLLRALSFHLGHGTKLRCEISAHVLVSIGPA
jgi:hypothetical protein